MLKTNNENGSSWKDLLRIYSKNGIQKSAEEQEYEACNKFMEILNEEKGKQTTIPKFYFKKPMNFNDLYFNVKNEAKTRFLSARSNEIPEKKSINISL